jgi:hypothetical protein
MYKWYFHESNGTALPAEVRIRGSTRNVFPPMFSLPFPRFPVLVHRTLKGDVCSHLDNEAQNFCSWHDQNSRRIIGDTNVSTKETIN